MTTAVTALVLLCIIAATLVVWGTIARNRWGLNFGSVNCPRCLHRIPGSGSLRQALFGGGRCAECKTLVDKWGREIMPRHNDRVKASRTANR